MSLSPRVHGRLVIGLCLFTVMLVRNIFKRLSWEPFIYYRPALIVDTTVRQQKLRRIFETVGVFVPGRKIQYHCKELSKQSEGSRP